MKKILLLILLFPILIQAQIKLVKDNFVQISSFMQYDNHLFFYASSGNNSGLWKTNGTTSGTVFVKSIPNGIEISGASQPAISGGFLYFTDGLLKLWRTDGTANGTIQLTSGLTNGNYNKIDLNGLLIFTENDSDGNELWRTDGSITGTYKITDFYAGSNSGVEISRNMAKQGSNIYFIGFTQTHPLGTLCKSDGTASGTEIVLNSGDNLSNLNVINNKIIYAGYVQYQRNCGVETQRRIFKVENGLPIIIRNPHLYYPDNDVNHPCGFLYGGDFVFTDIFKKSGNKLFFKAGFYPIPNVSEYRDALFVTDGDNTEMIKIFPETNLTYTPTLGGAIERNFMGTYTSLDNSFFENIFYFPAGDDNTGYEVWRSDGTSEGTFILKDIYPGVGTSEPKEFRTVNGITYFIAGDNTGRKLYQTDGTTLGTLPVPNPNNINLYEFPLSSIKNNSNQFSNEIGNKYLFVGAGNQFSGDALFVIENCQTNSSLTSGQWSSPITWSCGHIPLATENVEIAVGHIVTLNSNGKAKNIKLLGTLNFNNFEIKLNGN